MAEQFTHYSYLCSPIRPYREPTGMFDLRGDGESTRRTLVHHLLRNGELLAALPFPEIRTMKQLREALKWQDENS